MNGYLRGYTRADPSKLENLGIVRSKEKQQQQQPKQQQPHTQKTTPNEAPASVLGTY